MPVTRKRADTDFRTLEKSVIIIQRLVRRHQFRSRHKVNRIRNASVNKRFSITNRLFKQRRASSLDIVKRENEKHAANQNLSKKKCVKVTIGYIILVVVGGLLYHAFEFTSAEDSVASRKEELEALNAYFNHNDTIIAYLKEHASVLDDSTFVNTWDITSSIFFAFTIATTIGYGSFAPSTIGGKIFTIIYGLLSIPLTGQLISVVSEVAIDFFKYLYTMSIDTVEKAFDELNTLTPGNDVLDRKEMEQGLQKLNIKYTDHDLNQLVAVLDTDGNGVFDREEFKNLVKLLHANVSHLATKKSQIKITLVGLFLWLLIGSLVFALSESWYYGDAFYFSFITLSTIGLGDLTPNLENNMGALLFLYFFSFVGLGLLGVLLTLVIDALKVVGTNTRRIIRKISFRSRSEMTAESH
eukprot:g3058.t1